MYSTPTIRPLPPPPPRPPSRRWARAGAPVPPPRRLRSSARRGARRVLRRPARVIEDQRRLGEPLDRHRLARALRIGGDVEQLLATDAAHLQADVVDREDHEPGLEDALADG